MEIHHRHHQVKEVTAVPLYLQRLIMVAGAGAVRLLWAQMLAVMEKAAMGVTELRRRLVALQYLMAAGEAVPVTKQAPIQQAAPEEPEVVEPEEMVCQFN